MGLSYAASPAHAAAAERAATLSEAPDEPNFLFLGQDAKPLFTLPMDDLIKLRRNIGRCAIVFSVRAVLESFTTVLLMLETHRWTAVAEMASCVNIALIAWLFIGCNAVAGRCFTAPPPAEAVADAPPVSPPAHAWPKGVAAALPMVELLSYLAAIGALFRELTVFQGLQATLDIAASAQQWPGTLPVLACFAAAISLARNLHRRSKLARRVWARFLSLVAHDPDIWDQYQSGQAAAASGEVQLFGKGAGQTDAPALKKVAAGAALDRESADETPSQAAGVVAGLKAAEPRAKQFEFTRPQEEVWKVQEGGTVGEHFGGKGRRGGQEGSNARWQRCRRGAELWSMNVG